VEGESREGHQVKLHQELMGKEEEWGSGISASLPLLPGDALELLPKPAGGFQVIAPAVWCQNRLTWCLFFCVSGLPLCNCAA
jgi:hypothetical protein